MCGFAGVFDSHGIKEYDIDKMIRLIRHRGPNEQKIEMADKVFQIGFARLAIIDLKGGSQPMHSGDGGITVLCNGEIYNYRELKKKLAVIRSREEVSDEEITALVTDAGYKVTEIETK